MERFIQNWNNSFQQFLGAPIWVGSMKIHHAPKTNSSLAILSGLIFVTNVSFAFSSSFFRVADGYFEVEIMMDLDLQGEKEC